MIDHYNEHSLDTLCASLALAMGIEAPAQAAPSNPSLDEYINTSFGGKRADRIFMYNPDAIAQWVYEKYTYLLREVASYAPHPLPLACVMPSVTPVCFGTMYTGAQPSVHGIRRYEKPVITIDTLFDALLRNGKKVAIVADRGSSMAHIYNERNIDYYYYDTLPEINAKAAELIREDRHDFIAVYNANYDDIMHKYGPESIEALSELRVDSHAFAMFANLIKTHWSNHNTLLGFAMDHGCHEIDGGCGSHGLDMEEDINICHFYGAYPSATK